MKTNHTYKKHALATLVGSALLAISASAAHADTIMTFDFSGNFAMINADGTTVPNTTPAVTGTILLDAETFGGTAAMTGKFLNGKWTANGDLSAYMGTPVADKCYGAFMCAHSNIDFFWGGAHFPVQAAFGMTPMSPLTNLATLNLGDQFAVESLDTEPDGIKGTAMTSTMFVGYTPYFIGTATLSSVNLLGSPITNQGIYIAPVPEPSEWAMMLVGIGVVGALARARRRS